MKKYIAILLFALISALSFGQSNYQDVVYLKNGSIIRGVIIEQVPNKSIKVETADKSVFVYQIDEIEKITKEVPPETKESKNNLYKRKGYIGLSIGPSIPVGDFANKNKGFAKTGIQLNLINFGYRFSDNFGIAATWFGAANPIIDLDSDYMWSHGGLLTGPLFCVQVSEKVEWDIKPMLGLSWATATNTVLENSSAFAFNVGTGFRFNLSRLIALTIGVDYTSAKFDWDNFIEISMNTIAIKGGFAFRLK